MSSIKDELDGYNRSTGPRKKGQRLGATVTTFGSDLSCGSRCCKFSLLGLAIFLVCAGIAILAAGAYVQNNSDIVDITGTQLTSIVIAFGVLVLLIGVLGTAGSKMESRAVLSCFLVINSLMLIAIIIVGAWALSKEGKEEEIIAKAWQNASSDTKQRLQNNYYCCGCYYYGQATDTSKCPAGAKDPCMQYMKPDFMKIYTGFGVAFVILGSIMISGIVMGYCLMSGISDSAAKKKKSGRSRRY